MPLERSGRIARFINEGGLEALIATTPANVFYAAGYRSASQSLVKTIQVYAVIDKSGETKLVVMPSGDVPSAIDLTGAPWHIQSFGTLYFEGDEVGRIDLNRIVSIQDSASPSPAEALAAGLATLGINASRIGLDESGLTPANWKAIQEALPQAALEPAADLFLNARRIKDDGEVARLERAAQIAEEALMAAVGRATTGVTEREVGMMYRKNVIELGAEPGLCVITFGDRAALADTWPSKRPLAPGDVMRFDVGCVYEGYPSDIARTAVLGDPSDKLFQLYEAMRIGEEALFDAARPGVSGEDVYYAGLERVKEAGVSRYRRHHCGHAIGLEPYELPLIAPGHAQPLEAGMTFCLETPYYELGWGGVQVEDAVVITDTGCRILNKSPRTLWRAGEGR